MNPIKILIIEDNLPLRTMIQRRLGRLGFETFTAENGFEGEEQANRIQPDIILLDMNLPDKDGWQLATDLRNAESPIKDIPIIAVTAHAMTGDREKAIQAGCSDYMSKPIDFVQLELMIRQHLQ